MLKDLQLKTMVTIMIQLRVTEAKTKKKKKKKKWCGAQNYGSHFEWNGIGNQISLATIFVDNEKMSASRMHKAVPLTQQKENGVKEKSGRVQEMRIHDEICWVGSRSFFVSLLLFLVVRFVLHFIFFFVLSSNRAHFNFNE